MCRISVTYSRKSPEKRRLLWFKTHWWREHSLLISGIVICMVGLSIYWAISALAMVVFRKFGESLRAKGVCWNYRITGIAVYGFMILRFCCLNFQAAALKTITFSLPRVRIIMWNGLPSYLWQFRRLLKTFLFRSQASYHVDLWWLLTCVLKRVCTMYMQMTTTVSAIHAWTIPSVVHLVADLRAVRVRWTSQVPAANSVRGLTNKKFILSAFKLSIRK